MSYENTYTDTLANLVTNFERWEHTSNLNAQLGIQYAEPVSSRSLLLLKYTYSFTQGNIKREIGQHLGIAFNDTVQSKYFETQNIEHPFELEYQLNLNKFNTGCNVEFRPYKRWNVIDTSLLTQSNINYYP